MSFEFPPYQPMTDAGIERARRETVKREKVEPRVQAARFDPEAGHFVFEMKNGSTITTPAWTLEVFAQASDEQLADMRVVAQGSAVFWDSLDVQVTTTALLQLIFHITTSSEVARRAGRVTSTAKATAARANGRKGGRPRQRLATPDAKVPVAS